MVDSAILLEERGEAGAGRRLRGARAERGRRRGGNGSSCAGTRRAKTMGRKRWREDKRGEDAQRLR